MKQLIIDKLERLGATYKDDGGEWIKCSCQHPDQRHSHHTLSAGINSETGIHSCFKDPTHNFPFVTLEDTDGVDEEDLLWRARYHGMSISEGVEDTYWSHIDQPPVERMVTEDWRGISKELLAELCVYYCDQGRYRGRYVFGIHKDGQSVGFDARMVDDTAKAQEAKWLRPKGMRAQSIVYPKSKIQDMGASHIVITEGVMDAVSYIQMGIAAIPTFGVSPPSSDRIEQLLQMGVTSVTIAYDNDEAGRAGALNVLPYYSEWFDIVDHPMVAMIRNSSFKDANDFLVGVKENGLEKKEESWDNEEY